MALTEKQSKFLEHLFSDEFVDNPRAAALAAGFSIHTDISQIMESVAVKEEILRRADMTIVLNVPKSVKKILDVQDNPHKQGAKAQLEAAHSILDRAGMTKKERLEVEVKTPSGLVFLPPKKTD